jgi:hypothetical protein
MTGATSSEPIVIERPTARFWREHAGAEAPDCVV